MKLNRTAAAAFLAAVIALGIGSVALEQKAKVEAAGTQAPMFEVDPLWPKPLPNHWLLGATIGVSVDSRDHIWVIHRGASLEPKEQYAAQNPPAAECCKAAPPVLEFDAAGNLVGHWGGEGSGFSWPVSNHGITADHKGNLWIGSNGAGDNHILKFSQGGKFLLQIGKPKMSKGSNDIENMNRPAEVSIDKVANEVYVADGYGNKRVIVYDAESGKYKRHWGGYGNKPEDWTPPPFDPNAPPAKQFRGPVHCAEVSNDGLVYVCDRTANRIQVFKKDGTFVKEAWVAKNTLGDGVLFDIAFSKDPQQRFIYVADGSNDKIHILQRDTLEALTAFGDGGRQPGQFYAPHSIATDSKGNIYTTETYRGQRVQKFVYKGVGAVTKKDQGVVWPKR